MFRYDPLAKPEPLVRAVYSYVAYRVGPGADAEDLTSETFERAIKYRSSYDRAKGEPLTWLLGIARRVLASRATEPPAAAELGELPAAGFEEEALGRLELRAAVASLSSDD